MDQLLQVAERSAASLDKVTASLDAFSKTATSISGSVESGFRGLGAAMTEMTTAVNNLGPKLDTGFTTLAARVSNVQGGLTRVANLLTKIHEEGGTGFAAGAQGLDRYSAAIDQAKVKLERLKAEQARAGEYVPKPEAGPFTMSQMFPTLESWNKVVENMEKSYGKTYTELFSQTGSLEKIDLARLLTSSYDADEKSVKKYLDALSKVHDAERELVALTNVEADARERAALAAQKHAVAVTPEATVPGPATAPAAAAPASTSTLVGEARELTEELVRLQALRFQPLGASLMTNVRNRLTESTLAAKELQAEFVKLHAMMTTGMVPAEPAMPGRRTNVSYWAEQAGAGAATTVGTTTQVAAEQFDAIPESAQRAVERIIVLFEKLYHRLVGGSIVPDTVREINFWLLRIGEGESISGITRIGDKFLEVQERINNLTMMQARQPGGTLPRLEEQYPQWAASLDVEMKRRLEAMVIARDQMRAALQQAGPTQWQMIDMPEGYGRGQVPAAPQTALRLQEEQVAKLKASLAGLGTSEQQVADLMDRVYQAMEKQSRAGKRKEDIMRGLARGTTSVGDAEKQLQEATEQATRHTEGATGKVINLSSRFMRHLTWIAQGALIWGGYRQLRELVDTYVTAFSEIEQQAARTAFVVESTTESMIDAQRNAASEIVQYGAKPTEAAGAVTTAVRFGVEPGVVLEYAAQLAMVAKGELDVAQATEALLSINRQWNIDAEDTSQVLDVLATMYAEVPGSMKDFIALMQEGPGMARQMGQAFEENMLMVARAMTYLPSQTPSGVSSLMERMMSRMYQQDVARKLAQKYDISVFDPETGGRRAGAEVLGEVAEAYRTITSESERAALAELVAGTRQGKAWADAMIILQNYESIMSGTQTTLREFGDLSDNVLDTHQTKVDQLTAAWQLFQQTVGEGGVVSALDTMLGTLTTMLTTTTAIVEQMGLLAGLKFVVDTKRFGVGGALTRAQEGPEADFIKWLSDIMNLTPKKEPGDYGEQSRAWMWRESTREAGREFKQDVDGAGSDFKKNVEGAADALLTTMLSTGWTPPTSIVDLTGPEKDPYTTAQVEAAIQQSRADTARMIESYQGFLASSGMGPEMIELALANFMDKLSMQLQFYRMPGGAIKLMEGRDLLFYLSQIEENTRPLQGVWNVPEGMRVWVPIESTFYGEGMKKGGKPEDTVTLDSSAFDAASNRFASAVDAFSRSPYSDMAKDMTGLIDNFLKGLKPFISMTEGAVDWNPLVTTLAGMQESITRIARMADFAQGVKESLGFLSEFQGNLATVLGNMGLPPDAFGVSGTLESITSIVSTVAAQFLGKFGFHPETGAAAPFIDEATLLLFSDAGENLYTSSGDLHGASSRLDEVLAQFFPTTTRDERPPEERPLRPEQWEPAPAKGPYLVPPVGGPSGQEYVMDKLLEVLNLLAQKLGIETGPASKVPGMENQAPVLLSDAGKSLLSAGTELSAVAAKLGPYLPNITKDKVPEDKALTPSQWQPAEPMFDPTGLLQSILLSIKPAMNLVPFLYALLGGERDEGLNTKSTSNLPSEKGQQLPVPMPIKAGEPLGVVFPQNLIAQGVQLGVVGAGIPTAVLGISMAMSSLAGINSMQLVYLMEIARNTATAPTINVNVTGGEATVSSDVAEDLYKEWAMSPGTYEWAR